MAVTITVEKRGIAGDLRYVQGRIAADTSWLTAGEPFVAADIGLERIYFVDFEEQGGIVFHWDRANGTILAYRTGAADNAVLSVVVDAQNISAIATSVEFFAIGY